MLEILTDDQRAYLIGLLWIGYENKNLYDDLSEQEQKYTTRLLAESLLNGAFNRESIKVAYSRFFDLLESSD